MFEQLDFGSLQAPKLCPSIIFMESLQKPISPKIGMKNERLSIIIKKQVIFNFRIFVP
jgi:hypothetical protein